jgi:hypothetical protein
MWRGILIFLLMMLGVALVAGPPQQAQRKEQQTGAANPTALIDSPRAQTVPKGAGCPGTQQTKYDCNTISAIANIRQADAAERFNRLAIFEIGVGFVTAVVAFFAAVFAKNAVTAARANLAQDRETAKAERRAYLSIRFASAPEITSELDSAIITLGFENTGATPANAWCNDVVWVVTSQEPSVKLFNESFDKYPRDTQAAASFGPRQTKEIPFPTHLNGQMREKVTSGEWKFYIMGRVHYTDVFGDRHVTEFFYRYTPEMPNRMSQTGVCNHIG